VLPDRSLRSLLLFAIWLSPMKTSSRNLLALRANLFLQRMALGVLAVAIVTPEVVVAAPVESLRVMTYNIWNGGFGAFQPLSKTVDVINAAQADVIGIQETSASVDDLAALLPGFHWFHFNSDLSLLSRYPITAIPGTHARTRGAKLTLSPGQEVYIFDSHLEPFPYQPYQIRDGAITTEAQAIAAAQAARGVSLTAGLNNMAAALATDLPVFLVGDFNEPSHLDWTQEAADASLNFGLKVDWPTSRAITNAGFVDAFRAVRPDEVNDQGRTWTPGYPPPNVSVNEVHDRIDFVYYHEDYVTPVSATILGYNANDGNTDIGVGPGTYSAYPSDHRSVVVEFDLNLVAGDFDFDRDVDGPDFLAWQRGQSPVPFSAADLATWQTEYNGGLLVAESVAVPEPSALMLLIACLPCLMRRNCR